jgi:epoxyqueuosine reductase QueG
LEVLEYGLRRLARDTGVDLFGVADLTAARSFILAQGGEHIARFPRAVSLGMRLLDSVVDELFRHEEPSAIYTYRGLYNSANASLDRAALLVAKYLQEADFKAYPIPASQTINPKRLEGAFSHKLAAHLAGLGWIGKSCLLITPQHGPRVRLATVLTDASLQAGKPMPSRCGDCSKCVEICPVKAFTGVAFNSSEPREARFKASLCKGYTDKRAELLGEGLCGLCVYVCPWGRSESRASLRV